jgi:hypothetical protein
MNSNSNPDAASDAPQPANETAEKSLSLRPRQKSKPPTPKHRRISRPTPPHRPTTPGAKGISARVRTMVIGVLLVGLLAVGFEAFRHLRALQAIQPVDEATALALGVADVRYVDPQGRFALTTPSGWVVHTGEDIVPRLAIFRGPRDLEIWIEQNTLTHASQRRFREEIEDIEDQLGLNMNIQPIAFKGQPAFERRVRLFERQVLAIDVLIGRQAHHLQGAAPRDHFETYERLLRSILNTYEAGPVSVPGGEL